MKEKIPVISSGWWPFKNYTATSPILVVDTSLSKTFSVGRINNNDTVHISLSLITDSEIQFLNIDPMIEFTVKTKNGELFRANEKVYSHYFRMLKEKKGLWPNSDEWSCDFSWGDKYINRAVPFSKELPEKTKKISCSTMIKNPKEEIEVSIRCLSCSSEALLSAVIEFNSSWK